VKFLLDESFPLAQSGTSRYCPSLSALSSEGGLHFVAAKVLAERGGDALIEEDAH